MYLREFNPETANCGCRHGATSVRRMQTRRRNHAFRQHTAAHIFILINCLPCSSVHETEIYTVTPAVTQVSTDYICEEGVWCHGTGSDNSTTVLLCLYQPFYHFQIVKANIYHLLGLDLSATNHY